MSVCLVCSKLVSAFNDLTVGTKVTDKEGFDKTAIEVISQFDFASQRVPGQGFIPCDDLAPFISAGVGRRTGNPDDFIVRVYRGQADLYLRRHAAAEVERAAIIVYTREAYLADPDVTNDEGELSLIERSAATHVLVSVLGFAGPKAPLSPYRLVHNLAGGNHEALAWNGDEIRTKAAESKAYWDEWCVVAD